MSRRSVCRNLRARLLRARAVSLCLGKRSYFLRPLDLPRGRPSAVVSAFLSKWAKPFREFGDYDNECYDACLRDDAFSLVIVPECFSFLEQTGLSSCWFEIEERAELLGTPASLRVRTFDFLVTAGSIFDDAKNSCVFARDGAGELSVRRFVPIIGPAPRQRMRVRQIRDASNFSEVANG